LIVFLVFLSKDQRKKAAEKRRTPKKAKPMPAAFSKTSMLGQKSRLFLIAARLSKRYSH
jgi:hypothetical protein